MRKDGPFLVRHELHGWCELTGVDYYYHGDTAPVLRDLKSKDLIWRSNVVCIVEWTPEKK